MPRVRYLVWPLLALTASFVLVFALTFFVGSQARPTQPATTPTATPAPAPTAEAVVRTIQVVGRPVGAGQDTPALPPVVLTVLERDGDFVCLTGDLEQWGWRPAEPWVQRGQRLCHLVPPGQTIDLTFVPR